MSTTTDNAQPAGARHYAAKPMTGTSTSSRCATAGRSGCTETGSTMSPPIRRSATRCGWSPGCTTRCTAASTWHGDLTDRYRQWRGHHAVLQNAECVDDMVRERDAIAAWARMTYGWMGRSPDYKASFLGTLHAN